MNILIELPEEIVQKLEATWGDVPRKTLEALAVEAYRAGVLSSAQVQQMLHLPSRWETESFLKKVQAYLDYTEADLEQDIQTLRSVTPK
jgi:predicted HTH domain antitoxin